MTKNVMNEKRDFGASCLSKNPTWWRRRVRITAILILSAKYNIKKFLNTSFFYYLMYFKNFKIKTLLPTNIN